jgi:hypothetical protein
MNTRNTLSRRLMLAAILFAFAIATALSPAAIAAEKAKDSKGTPPPAATQAMDPAMQAAMAEMTKLATPGPMHELLRSFAGNWKTSNKTWMGPGDPVLSEGTCKREMVLGGRFLQSSYKGTMMDMPFEGMELLGFDQKTNQFVSVWMDNMGTGMVVSNGGQIDPTGKVITVNMNMDDPMTKKSVPYKMVTKIVDPNKHVFTMTSVRDGKEMTEMEITYTRAN